MLWLVYILIMISSTNTFSVSTVRNKSLLHLYYWEVKPYIFRNSDGELDGIIPRIFEEGLYYCSRHLAKDTKIVDFKYRFDSHYDFMRTAIARNNKTYNSNRQFWAPVMTYVDRETKKKLGDRGLVAFQLLKSKTIVVIVPRYHISLPHKIFRGILSCQQIFVLALLLAIFFGIVVWLPERLNNRDFHVGFIRGMSTGLWWSIVSMTTVGYGDIAPKSLLGRLVAVVWLIIGVMIACVMTATMTDVVTGFGDVNVNNKKVAVLENSHEAKVASNDYRAIVVPAKSYEQAIEMVREQKVFAAMMNEEVASWYEDLINDDESYMPLRIVQKLPANLYMKCFSSQNVSLAVKKVFTCMHQQSDEIYLKSQEHFQRYTTTQVLYVDSLKDLFLHNSIIQVLVGIVISLLIIGIGFDAVRHFSQSKKSRKVPSPEVKMKLYENGHRNQLSMA